MWQEFSRKSNASTEPTLKTIFIFGPCQTPYETLAFPVLVHDCVFRVVDKMTGDVFGSLDESQTSGVPWQSCTNTGKAKVSYDSGRS